MAIPPPLLSQSDCTGHIVRVDLTMTPSFTLEVVCAFSSVSRGIGSRGSLPWHIPSDLRRFKRITVGDGHNAVIMGSNTWLSLPEKHRPLPNRLNIVLTSDPTKMNQKVETAPSLEHALAWIQSQPLIKRVFVIGGEVLFQAALQMSNCLVLHLTKVTERPEHPTYDKFFPHIDDLPFQEIESSDIMEERGESFQFQTYIRRPESMLSLAPVHDEQQYLDLIRKILSEGSIRSDRTGTGTIALFGATMRFNLRDNKFPLLTTKRVFWRGVVEELLWFINGSTNGNLLSEKGVRIWEGNGSREYLDRVGLPHREVGDLGPVYGFQWRHFGARYSTSRDDYTGKGTDQLADVIRRIKTDPTCRRIIMSAWNPTDLTQMALPPCHMFCQFFVNMGELSCLMYQRSCDMGLGVPFNIASYSLLTCIVAHACGLKPGEFVHVLGDAHVYSNHVDAVRQQIERQPRPFPTLTINTKNTDIDNFKFDDFVLSGYDPYPAIKMEMAV